jgi:hypothetical protein
MFLENTLIKFGLNLKACNAYFDNLKHKSEDNAEEVLLWKKKAYLEELRAFQLVGDHKQILTL